MKPQIKHVFEIYPNLDKLFVAKGRICFSENLAKSLAPKGYKTYKRPAGAGKSSAAGTTKKTESETKTKKS